MKRKVRITGLPKMSGGGAPKRTFGDQAPPVVFICIASVAMYEVGCGDTCYFMNPMLFPLF